MVNSEVFGGLVSAMSRGESLQKAMTTLFNAGYSKNEIEEAARILNSKTPTEVMQTIAQNQKELAAKKQNSGKKESIFKKIEAKTISPLKESRVRQVASSYGDESPREFKGIVSQAIMNLSGYDLSSDVPRSDLEFNSSKNTQHISNYSSENSRDKIGQKISGKKKKLSITILIILIVLLLGALLGIFVFKDKLLALLNSLGL